ncbi:MAG TPA: hypothetical protein VF159_03295 [Gemmatimonadaceae bacterium]
MAAFDSYSDLQDTVVRFAAREGDADFEAAVPAFIALAEATIRRRVRRKRVRKMVQFTQAAVQLPQECGELTSVRLVTGIRGQDGPLKIGTPEQLAEMRTVLSSAGVPRFGAVVGSELLLAPAPDDAYDAELVFFEKLVPLSDANPTNLYLSESPDLYLYGALTHSAPFLEHDERMPMWRAVFDAAVEELNLQREREEYSAGLRPARLPVVLG